MPFWNTARLTGYHPKDVRDLNGSKLEGKDIDSKKQPLHYLEHFDINDPNSFVGLSADNKVFSYGDKISIQEFPEIRFIVRDNGGGFNGKTGGSAFDVPVLTEKKAREITQNIHWRRVNDYRINDVAISINKKIFSYNDISNANGIFIISVLIGLLTIRNRIRL